MDGMDCMDEVHKVHNVHPVHKKELNAGIFTFFTGRSDIIYKDS